MRTSHWTSPFREQETSFPITTCIRRWYVYFELRLLLPSPPPSFLGCGGTRIRLLIFLFLFYSVCSPEFIVTWNGGERLVFAFVLLSMKSNHVFDWSVFSSLSFLITVSVFLGGNLLIQWAVLIIALSSLSSSFILDPPSSHSSSMSEATMDEEGDASPYNPSYEANLLPPATTVGFYSSNSLRNSRDRKRILNNKRRR